MNTLYINQIITEITAMRNKQLLNEQTYNNHRNNKTIEDEFIKLNSELDFRIVDLENKIKLIDKTKFEKIYLIEREFSSDMDDLAGQKVRYYDFNKKYGDVIMELYIDEKDNQIFKDIIYSGVDQFSLEINGVTKLFTDLGDFFKEYNNEDSFGKIMLIEFSDDFEPR